ncbi:hypothetical protein Lal_00023630 [Lupinus albus]|nr:hypothetical protein Lal_00023604 [Lupinus albus]KAF1898625.1 hypothetical protein Lal_00023630 [Lupinus albus]
MDDVGRKIDLKEVGVPFGDQHKGYKLLLTSRDLNVLSKGMVTQHNFRLVTLSKEEVHAFNVDLTLSKGLPTLGVALACNMGLR